MWRKLSCDKGGALWPYQGLQVNLLTQLLGDGKITQAQYYCQPTQHMRVNRLFFKVLLHSHFVGQVEAWSPVFWQHPRSNPPEK